MSKLSINEPMIRKLAKLLDETGLSEIEYKVGDQAIKVSKYTQISHSNVSNNSQQNLETNIEQTEGEEFELKGRSGSVTAPMVGVVYLSPEPGEPPFIKPGDEVIEGQTLLLIEAMKTFNPVKAPRSGNVREIKVTDQTPVEFGEELVILE